MVIRQGEDGASAPAPLVVYFRPGPHPYANVSFEEVVRSAFPSHEVVVVDVVQELRRDRLKLLAAVASAALAYGPDLLTGRRRGKDVVLRTPRAFSLLRSVAHRAMTQRCGRLPDVTVQIQSLFDAHVPGVPHLVYTDHTHLTNLQYADFDPSRLYTAAWVDAERQVYAHAAHCLVRSSHVARSLQEDYGVPPHRVHVVGAGINAQVTAGPAAPSASLDVVFVGVDWERKGGPVLVEAFRRVLAVVPGATLTIIGCQPAVDLPGVRVLGRLPLMEVSQHLHEAAVFCLPTTVEPFGIAFLEAMAHGLPVVATRVGAVPDFVLPGVNGYTVPVGDVEGLAGALVRLLQDAAARDDMGRASSTIVQQRYTWPAVADRIREIVHGTIPKAPT